MKIDLEKIEKNPDSYIIKGACEDHPELLEIGCFGEFVIELSMNRAGRKLWIEGTAAAGYTYECAGCGSPLKGVFNIPVKLLAEPGKEPSLEWQEEKSQSYDDYYVKYGKDVQEIPIIAIIREQILINCASAFPGETAEDKCKDCKGMDYRNYNPKPEKGTDPRWQKLEELLNKQKN